MVRGLRFDHSSRSRTSVRLWAGEGDDQRESQDEHDGGRHQPRGAGRGPGRSEVGLNPPEQPGRRLDAKGLAQRVFGISESVFVAHRSLSNNALRAL